MLRKIPLLCIRLYQLTISPLLGNCCRFSPSCSNYAIEAIHAHGYKALWLIVKRIVKCHPWHPGGNDPVP